MKWNELLELTQLITSGLLVIMDAVTFVHVKNGTGYKLVLMLVAMLLTSNVFYLLNCGANYKVIVLFNSENYSKIFEWQTITGIGFAIGDLLFSVSHWMIAVFYLKMAKNMPRVNEQVEAPKPYTLLKWAGIAINTILPLCELATWISY